MDVPIVFAIDNNVVVQCGVTITSLLLNAKEETCYNVFILYENHKLPESSRSQLMEAFRNINQCKLSFVEVRDDYSDVSITGVQITLATYYRLSIPSLFPQFDKVIYADIDMIFQQDLSDLYQTALQHGELVAAAPDLAIDDKYFFKSPLPAKVGKSEKDYFNAGFLVMNLKQMREENVTEEFNRHAKIKYDQNDQDVLNVVCNGRVQILPSMYNFQLNHFSNYMWGRKTSEIQFGELFKHATLHYTWKHKPWNSLECVAYDTWWHYYKMSPFYDDMVYFKRQYEQIEACRNDYHQRSNSQLFKRIMANVKHKRFK